MCREVRPEIGDKDAGFTIFEVLIAITIVVTALAAIGHLTGVHDTRRAFTRATCRPCRNGAVGDCSSAITQSAFVGESIGDLDGSRWRIGVSPFFGSAPALPDSPGSR